MNCTHTRRRLSFWEPRTTSTLVEYIVSNRSRTTPLEELKFGTTFRHVRAKVQNSDTFRGASDRRKTYTRVKTIRHFSFKHERSS